MSDKCFYCDSPAVRYCDFKIGGEIGGYERIGPMHKNTFYACFAIDKLPFTCDMPMCADHCKQVGNVFMPGDIETIDHCPEHIGRNDADCCPCTEEEASAMRREIQASARRRLIRQRNSAA